MDILPCPVCDEAVYPEALRCPNGHEVAYDPLARRFAAPETPCCANRAQLGCSWVAQESGPLCLSCAMTETVPDLSEPQAQKLWADTEAAKRWVLVGLMRLGWFRQDGVAAPQFKLLSEKIEGERQKVMMGHLDGVITLNIMEADPATAQFRRQQFDEPLRTMIGHVRHEMAHFLFDQLAAEDPQFLEQFRPLMGDERADYGEALQAHYANGPEEGYLNFYISAYATAHPHEDWAETTAHALHMEELAHSAQDLGLRLKGRHPFDKAQNAGLMLNHMCRSLGQPDPYPMIISPKVREKLDFALHWLDKRPRLERFLARAG